MDRNYFDLKDNVAIVTVCSGGLCVQMAKALASQGASIVAVARRKERIEAIAREIADEFGVPTFAVQCDIKSTEAVDAMVDAVVEKFGVLTSWSTTPAPAPSATPRTSPTSSSRMRCRSTSSARSALRAPSRRRR